MRIVPSGAARCYGVPAIVIDFGTATTLGVIDENSVFKGGMIIPGVDGLIDQLSTTLNATPKIIATGGMSKTIVPHCRHQITIDPHLLFKGLFQAK